MAQTVVQGTVFRRWCIDSGCEDDNCPLPGWKCGDLCVHPDKDGGGRGASKVVERATARKAQEINTKSQESCLPAVLPAVALSLGLRFSLVWPRQGDLVTGCSLGGTTSSSVSGFHILDSASTGLDILMKGTVSVWNIH